MKRLGVAFILLALVVLGTTMPSAARPQQPPSPPTPWLVAHRGASAYAPENTVPAFRLAADQGATFVEFDLRLTKDRQIVCLHDESLERTTDVEEIFPDRFRTLPGAGGAPTRRWLLADFTLAELRTLDAGSWFSPSFRGTRLPTFAETIDSLRGRSGLFIELKSPEKYEGIERMILAELAAKGLDRPGADPKTPVLLQTFTASSLQTLAGTGTKLPLHFLVGARDAAPWLTEDGLTKLKAFATGLSPEKTIVTDHRDRIARARQLGLLVTPYTFRASAVTGFPDVRAEMAHYLDTLTVDGVITDNPDQMPSRPAAKR
jgi:glycerophosphoryl diester phosphodiesterase